MKTGIKNSLLALGFFGILASITSTASAGYFDNAPATRCDVQLTRNMQTGSEGTEVTVLQSFLNRAGYLGATPNGYFGPSTTSAVRAFQRDNGLSASGYVGDATLNAINERFCDTDLRGNNLSYSNYGYGSSYGYSSGVTYVDAFDPYVRVVSPQVTNPIVYSNPLQHNTASIYTTPYSNNYNSNVPFTSQVQGTNIVYNPTSGYLYGVTPQPGVLTIITPNAGAAYFEGDSVNISWTTNNLNNVIANGYQILLENTSSNQSKVAAITQSNSTSFVLTKELLDSVCVGICDKNNTGSFRIVITTPVTDIAGVTTIMRAAVAPITIKRPFYGTYGVVTINGSKNPVDSGEIFKLYVNIPSISYFNPILYNGYSFSIRAVCANSIGVNIAGFTCGQEFSAPVNYISSQQEIPTIITNPIYYKQDVAFVVTVYDPSGVAIGTSQTIVSVNPKPFSF